MRRFPSKWSLAALLVAFLALPAFAEDRAAGHHGGLKRFKSCLTILDLQPDQKSDIRSILEAAKPALEADHAAVRADREKLREDVNASPVDPCLVGTDFLAVRADAKKLRDQILSVIDQIKSKLTPDQNAKLEGCLEAPPVGSE